MIDAPEIAETKAQPAAVIHFDIPRHEMMAVFGPAVEELLGALGAQGIKPLSAAFAHHLKMSPERFNFELGFVTEKPVEAAGRVKPGDLPARKVARTIYHGPYEGLPSAWGEFDKWMKAQGLKQADDLWEVYTHGPQSDPDPKKWWTELVRPLVG
ncbi:MAG TPA: GyrI-like domain-containing protein [Fibrobacteria bacterium]|nr:GyrI-like domain-containing protein [Fibrobacteria bacterium]